jgi:hypothetical protein
VPRNNEPDYVFIRRAPQEELCRSVLGYEGGQIRIVLNKYTVLRNKESFCMNVCVFWDLITNTVEGIVISE